MNDCIKLTEYNLKNVNEYKESINYFKRELLVYSGQEEKFKSEINSLNQEINKYTDLLEKIKLSMEVLSPLDKKIIEYFYFKKLTGNDISAQLKISIATIFARKTKVIEELSKLLYGHFDVLNIEPMKIKPYKKPTRPRPVYQYDLDGVFIKKWSSAREFCDKYNYNANDLRNACIGGIKTFKGYKWSYEPIQRRGTNGKLQIY